MLKKLLLLVNQNRASYDKKFTTETLSEIVNLSTLSFKNIIIIENNFRLNLHGKGYRLVDLNVRDSFFSFNRLKEWRGKNDTFITSRIENKENLNINIQKLIKANFKKIIRIQNIDVNSIESIIKKKKLLENSTLVIDTAFDCEDAFKKKYDGFDFYFIELARNIGCFTEFIHLSTKLQIDNGKLSNSHTPQRSRHLPNHISVVDGFGTSLPKAHRSLIFKASECCILLDRDYQEDGEILKKALGTLFYPPEIYFSYGNCKEHSHIIQGLKIEIEKNFPLAHVLIDREDVTIHSSIGSFINKLKHGRHVILIINDKFIKSKYCIDELHGLYKAAKGKYTELKNRIHPFLLEDAHYVYDDLAFNNVIEDYWVKSNKISKRSALYKFIKKIPSLLKDHYNVTDNEILHEKRLEELGLAIEKRIIDTGKMSNKSMY